MPLSLRKIRYFAAVSEHGSLSLAAKQLSISLSSVTVAIQDLEGELGCRLFERHARGMELTSEGQIFLRHATKVMATVNDARHCLEDRPTVAGGKLSLGVTQLVAGYVLADLLERFRRAFPGVALTVVEDDKEYLEHLLINGELDVAAFIYSEDEAAPAFIIQKIQSSSYRLWLPSRHRSATSRRVSLKTVGKEAHVLLDTDELAQTAEIVWRRMDIQPPVVLRTRSVEAARSLVATGAAVAVLPDLVYRPWSLEGDRIAADRGAHPCASRGARRAAWGAAYGSYPRISIRQSDPQALTVADSRRSSIFIKSEGRFLIFEIAKDWIAQHPVEAL